jgi:hypothetical protein
MGMKWVGILAVGALAATLAGGGPLGRVVGAIAREIARAAT